MARRPPLPVKLFVELSSSDEDLLRRGRQLVRRHCGEWDVQSPIWTPARADGDGAEPGPKHGLSAFAPLASPEQFVQLAQEVGAIERRIVEECEPLGVSEPVRIRPGYVDDGKVVLASGGNQPHHLYLTHGVYADLQLISTGGPWQPLPWTAAAFRRPDVMDFFTRVRESLLAQRRQHLAGAADPSPAT